MREIEKYYFDYIILGLPKKPFRYLWGFFAQRGVRPTVYSEKTNWAAKLLGLAKFCVSDFYGHDGVIFECLKRHARRKGARRLTLIIADPRFKRFIEHNRESLERLFIIQEITSQETANET